ncbi:MAG: cupin domain-containing protein [Acidimicrobiaceae bacterium]|nr:cupin domain-containing protein [Acidimicrobiaceae bacterium]MBO0747193.1 cupin domain-containing protein [Acidimicrobiaceae bacterium]
MAISVLGPAGIIEDGAAQNDRATVFSANGFPLLSAGSTTDLVARTSSMWVHVKVYADGGENALHTHSTEDHVFVILDGEATFYDENGEETVVSKNDGVLVPRKTLYRFRSSGSTNLVMLRIGAPAGDEDLFEATWGKRLGRSGALLPGNSPENGTGAIRGTPVPGKTFGR